MSNHGLSKRLRSRMESPGMDAPVLGSATVFWWCVNLHVPGLTDAEIDRLETALRRPLDNDHARVGASAAVRWLTLQIMWDDRLPRLKDCHDHLDKIVSAGLAFISLLHHERGEVEAVPERLAAGELAESYVSLASAGKLQSCLDEVYATIKLAADAQREIKTTVLKRGKKADVALGVTMQSLVQAATFAGADLELPGTHTLDINPDASTPLLAFARTAIAIAAEKLATSTFSSKQQEQRASSVLRGYQPPTLTGRALRDKLRAAKTSVKKYMN